MTRVWFHPCPVAVLTIIRADLGIEVSAVELYLGSNREVTSPCLWPIRKALDFGAGAYLTDDLVQARWWATLKMERAGTGLPLVSLFDFDGAQVGRLAVLMHERPDLSWLAYVADNRRGCRSRDDWDLMVGSVAGEQSMPALGLYLRGYLTAEVALGMLSTRCLCR